MLFSFQLMASFVAPASILKTVPAQGGSAGKRSRAKRIVRPKERIGRPKALRQAPAERIMRSNSRGRLGSMRPDRGDAEELPRHARGRIFRIGSRPALKPLFSLAVRTVAWDSVTGGGCRSGAARRGGGRQRAGKRRRVSRSVTIRERHAAEPRRLSVIRPSIRPRSSSRATPIRASRAAPPPRACGCARRCPR